ncbi:MAG: hypothetical protein HQL18_04150 [Candidatus Omnitrophica bacterium]|nr:hypothetical protein [Candidatus Omnitrophota bacterium]
MVLSGCRHIIWGVETLSEKILSKIDKKITREAVIKAFDICAKFTDRLTTAGYFCVGTPGETEESVQETVDYANKYLKSTHGPGASMLYILPGTRIYADLVREGKFDERSWVRTELVQYYTHEQSMFTLNRWRKMVNSSGTKIPYTKPYFWDTIPQHIHRERILGSRSLAKVGKKVRRVINMFFGRCD